MNSNINRMQSCVSNLSAKLRPHVKTAKSIPIANAMKDAGAEGIAVSTLKEAEEFFSAGVSSDIMYCVCIVQSKLKWVYDLMQRGCDLKIVTDSVATAQHIASFSAKHDHSFKVLIEIDTDGHRSGCPPNSALLLDIAAALGPCGVHGVMAHAGESYELSTPEALQAMAEQERSLTVLAAERLRAAGHSCPVVSIGSTPTALSYSSLSGVTEVRAGVYIFFDLVMFNIGVCSMQEIALSVLATVIGHQEEKGWVITDAGWMAMSRDRGVPGQQPDFGYGQVCRATGDPLKGVTMTGANQEHGIITCSDLEALKESFKSRGGTSIARQDISIVDLFPVGTQLRVLPNHSCATAAQFPSYHMIDATGKISEIWERFYGW